MKVSAALLSLVSLVAAAPATLAPRDAPAGVSITSITYGGSGCPQGSMNPQLSPDRTQIFVNYNNKLFTANGNGDIVNSRKFCQLSLGLKYPSGWTFAVASTYILGSLNLPANSVATIDVSYYTSGDTNDVGTGYAVVGPKNSGFTLVDDLAILKYSKCASSTENLNIVSSIRVSGKGSITLDAAATAFVVGLNWKEC